MKRSLFLALPLVLLGGCAAQNGAANTDSLLTRVAQSIVGGKAYDRAVVAARDGDDAAFLRAERDVERAGGEFSAPGASSLAGQAVQMAMDFGQKAQKSSDANAEIWHQKEAEQYRRALRLGAARSDNPEILNAIGYFLAERGTSAADFKQAEQMTRKSLKLWQELVDGATLETSRAVYRFSMANVRDSLAWALFRQNRLPEAAQEQERAINEATQAAQKSGNGLWSKMPPELPYHLGEIYRAQTRVQDAAQQYQRALKLDPNFADAQRALKKLNGGADEPASDRMDL